MHKNCIYHSNLDPGSEISFGSGKKDDVFVEDFEARHVLVEINRDSFSVNAKSAFGVVTNNIPFDTFVVLEKIDRTLVFVSRGSASTEKTQLRIPYNCNLKVGRAVTNDIVLNFPFVSSEHFIIRSEQGIVRVKDKNSTNGLFLNGKKIGAARMRSGDELSVMNIRMRLLNGVLSFENAADRVEFRLYSEKTAGAASFLPENSGRLKFRRSPRPQEKLPSEDIVLANAPSKAQRFEKGKGALSSLIGSGAMMAGTLLTGAISPALLAARAASLVMPVSNAATNSGSNKRRRKSLEQYEAARQEKYGAYIAAQKARIESVASLQRDIVSRENPSPSECLEIVSQLRRNLWERSPEDRDFLDVRIGMGYEPLCVNVKANQDPSSFQMEDDEVHDLADHIIEETRIVDNVPVRISLQKNASVGIVGPREQTVSLVKNMLTSLCTSHCAEDIRLACLFDDDETKVWEELRWLPQIWDDEMQHRLIAFGKRDSDILSAGLSELVSRRVTTSAESSDHQERPVLPHYILVFGSKDLAEGSELVRKLSELKGNIGITSIFLFDEIYRLPRKCGFIVELGDSPCAYDRLEYNNRFYFTLDEPLSEHDLAGFSRTMSAIELESYSKAAPVPVSVTFLEGYGVRSVEQLDVAARWRESRPYETLAAPLGVMEGGRIFSLDIHEKAHGPHGLIAGTTGSGKSELIQSWILSMALNYHPWDVSFVLIDYKGGGMANMLEPLPHVVGKITNIGTNINRSMISLQSEIKRRQRIFDAAGVNHIDKYQKLYKNGTVLEPLPHLIIVSDEFAELKKENPDFMAALVSASRVGRSLGIHLVLATQKPGGVVDDQIQSNSRFRLCLKVQDAADSREMIKRPDAALITKPGRSYIRVGEDEIFSLFQSYWSGAAYAPDEEAEDELCVPLVGMDGNRMELFPKPKKKKISDIDELRAVTEYIVREAEMAGLSKLPGPWLDELPEKISLASAEEKTAEYQWPAIPVGIFDIPRLQAQGVEYIDFAETGHYAVYGAPGTGKTTFLKTLLLGIGRNYTPDEMCAYVLDAGGWSLSAFSEMPNVGAVVLDREDEKVDKLQRLIMSEFEKRKQYFLKNSVSSLKAYRRDISPDLPAIVLIIDNIVPVLEAYPDIEGFLSTIARDGATYGIYLIFTANSTTGVRYKVVQNIRGAVSFELSDRNEYSGIVGRPESALDKTAGRAYMKGNPPVVFQAALPFDCESDHEMTESIRRECRQLRNCWHGRLPERIRTMPDSISQQDIWSEIKDGWHVAAGIGFDDMEPAVFDLSKKYCMLVAGPDNYDKGSLLCSMVVNIRKSATVVKTVAFAEKSRAAMFDSVSDVLCAHDDDKAVSEAVADIISELRARQGSEELRRRQLLIAIDDLKGFVDAVTDENRDAMERICRLSEGLGLMVLCTGGLADMSAYSQIEPLTRTVIASGNGLGLEEAPSKFSYYQSGLSYQEAASPAGRGNAYMFCSGRCKKIKLPQ